MSDLRQVLLGLQGIVFAIWAVLMFRWLFEVRRRAEAETGQTFSGPVAFLRAARGWWRDPARAGQRWLLPALTVLLFILILLGLPRLPGG